MTTREQFKRRVIELIHGGTYDETIEKEREYDPNEPYNDDFLDYNEKKEYNKNFKGNEITIGRVMQALNNFHDGSTDISVYINANGEILYTSWGSGLITTGVRWKLTKENGQEANDDSQSDETIESILSLLK
jgi:hypothetical protein